MRKTIELIELIEFVNKALRESPDISEMRGVRRGMATVLEHTLMKADAYAGYGYLTENQVPQGCDPGIVTVGGKTEFPDVTRRAYYIDRRLK